MNNRKKAEVGYYFRNLHKEELETLIHNFNQEIAHKNEYFKNIILNKYGNILESASLFKEMIETLNSMSITQNRVQNKCQSITDKYESVASNISNNTGFRDDKYIGSEITKSKVDLPEISELEIFEKIDRNQIMEAAFLTYQYSNNIKLQLHTETRLPNKKNYIEKLLNIRDMKVNILEETINKILEIPENLSIKEIFNKKEVEKIILDHLSIGLLIIILESNPDYLLKITTDNSMTFQIIEELGFINKEQFTLQSEKGIIFETILLKYFIIFIEKMLKSIESATEEHLIFEQMMKHFIFIEILFRSIQIFNNKCHAILNYLARQLSLKKDDAAKGNRELNMVIENILQKLLNLNHSENSLKIFTEENLQNFIIALWRSKLEPNVKTVLSLAANKIENLDDIHSIFISTIRCLEIETLSFSPTLTKYFANSLQIYSNTNFLGYITNLLTTRYLQIIKEKLEFLSKDYLYREREAERNMEGDDVLIKELMFNIIQEFRQRKISYIQNYTKFNEGKRAIEEFFGVMHQSLDAGDIGKYISKLDNKTYGTELTYLNDNFKEKIQEGIFHIFDQFLEGESRNINKMNIITLITFHIVSQAVLLNLDLICSNKLPPLKKQTTIILNQIIKEYIDKIKILLDEFTHEDIDKSDSMAYIIRLQEHLHIKVPIYIPEEFHMITKALILQNISKECPKSELAAIFSILLFPKEAINGEKDKTGEGNLESSSIELGGYNKEFECNIQIIIEDIMKEKGKANRKELLDRIWKYKDSIPYFNKEFLLYISTHRIDSPKDITQKHSLGHSSLNNIGESAYELEVGKDCRVEKYIIFSHLELEKSKSLETSIWEAKRAKMLREIQQDIFFGKGREYHVGEEDTSLGGNIGGVEEEAQSLDSFEGEGGTLFENRKKKAYDKVSNFFSRLKK